MRQIVSHGGVNVVVPLSMRIDFIDLLLQLYLFESPTIFDFTLHNFLSISRIKYIPMLLMASVSLYFTGKLYYGKLPLENIFQTKLFSPLSCPCVLSHPHELVTEPSFPVDGFRPTFVNPPPRCFSQQLEKQLRKIYQL